MYCYVIVILTEETHTQKNRVKVPRIKKVNVNCYHHLSWWLCQLHCLKFKKISCWLSVTYTSDTQKNAVIVRLIKSKVLKMGRRAKRIMKMYFFVCGCGLTPLYTFIHHTYGTSWIEKNNKFVWFYYNNPLMIYHHGFYSYFFSILIFFVTTFNITFNFETRTRTRTVTKVLLFVGV